MKKLYEVEIRYYVMAENETEAEAIRTDDGVTLEVNEAFTVDSEWWDTIPFGGDDDRTCGEILGAQRE